MEMMSTTVPLTTEKTKVTYTEYSQMVDDHPHSRVELLEGEVFMSPAPMPIHQIILRNLMRLLDRYVEANNLGEVLFAPVGVRLAENVVVQPDLLFIQQEKLAELIGSQNIEGAPNLVVEILSPGTAHHDRHNKLLLYARYGVAEYWIVDPENKAVELYILDGETYRVSGIYLSGDTVTSGQFAPAEIQVDAIFA
jgi:Uma2 family endonuclease